MASWKRRLAFSAGIVAIIVVALAAYLWWAFDYSQAPSTIANFHPVEFQATANEDFFYSIGDELKNSNRLDPNAPTLLHGHIRNFQVAPDHQRIAVVANGVLAIVDRHGKVRPITPVDSIYRESPPIGQQFFRDNNFQWTADSQNLYMIKDEFYKSHGSQLYSIKGELWKYDLRTGALQLVLKPFPAYNYFFGSESGIYFSVPTDTGDLVLKYFDGHRSIDASSVDTYGEAGSGIGDSLFYSFDINDTESAILPSQGVALNEDSSRKTQSLVIASKSYLSFTQGVGLKGDYFCSQLLRSNFLPGDRYFLFNTPYCGNYNGQLLINLQSGEYQRLPAETVVYITPNTTTYTDYRLTAGGIVAR